MPCSDVIANPKFSILRGVRGGGLPKQVLPLFILYFLCLSDDFCTDLPISWSLEAYGLVFSQQLCFSELFLCKSFPIWFQRFRQKFISIFHLQKIQGHYTSLGLKRMSSIIGTERQLSTNLVFPWSYSLTIIILLLPYYRNLEHDVFFPLK